MNTEHNGWHKSQYEKSDYDRITQNLHTGLTESGRRLFSNLDHRKKTLEVGTSAGRISFEIEEKMDFSNITAIDIVPRFIEEAKRRAKKKNSNIIFEVADITSLHYQDETFDQIICLGVVLSHIIEREERIKALREMSRVLNKSGIMVIGVRNYLQGGYMEIVKMLVWLLRKFYNPMKYKSKQILPRLGIGGYPDPFFLRSDKPQLYFYEPAELIHDILSAGFYLKSFNTTGQEIYLNNKQSKISQKPYICKGYGISAIAIKP